MAAIPVPRAERVSTSKIWRAGLAAAIAAAVANLLVLLLWRNVFGLGLAIPLQGAGPAEPLPSFMVAVASAVPAVGATLLLAILARFARRPFLILQIVAVVFGLLSLGGPMSLPVDIMTRVALSSMHVVAGFVIVAMLIAGSRQG